MKKKIKYLKNSLSRCSKEEEIVIDKMIKELKETTIPEINNIRDFEKKIHKDIRTCCVKQVVSNYKSCLSNLQNGHIKFFSMDFLKRDNVKNTFPIDKSLIRFIKHKGFYINFENKKPVEKQTNPENFLYRTENT